MPHCVLHTLSSYPGLFGPELVQQAQASRRLGLLPVRCGTVICFIFLQQVLLLNPRSRESNYSLHHWIWFFNRSHDCSLLACRGHSRSPQTRRPPERSLTSHIYKQVNVFLVPTFPFQHVEENRRKANAPHFCLITKERLCKGEKKRNKNQRQQLC